MDPARLTTGLYSIAIEFSSSTAYCEGVSSTSILSPPLSGLWRGSSRRVALARQGSCGERLEARESDTQVLWAVLFFDVESVFGHAILGDSRFTLGGWWGPAKHLRPAVTELAETELWGSGPAGFHLTLGDGSRPDVCFAWSDGKEISGYRRREGG